MVLDDNDPAFVGNDDVRVLADLLGGIPGEDEEREENPPLQDEHLGRGGGGGGGEELLETVLNRLTE